MLKNKKSILTLLLAMILICTSLTGCFSEEFWDGIDEYLEEEPTEEHTGGIVTDGGNGIVELLSQQATSWYDPDFIETLHDASGIIQDMEIIQVMAYRYDIETDSREYMDTFVAQKPIMIAVNTNQAITVDTSGQTQYLEMYRNGELVDRFSPSAGNLNSENRIVFNLNNIVDILTPGHYTFKVVVPDGEVTRNATLRETTELRILAVPIIGNYNGEIMQPNDDWKKQSFFTEYTYPISKGKFTYDLGAPIDLSGSEYDLSVDDNFYNVWTAINSLQSRTEPYDMIVGFFPFVMGQDADTFGYTFEAPANIVYSGDPAMAATVAHEIAHCYMVGDEYDGGSYNFNSNMPPYQFTGTEMSTYNEVTAYNENIVDAWDLGAGATGTVVPSSYIPINLYEMTYWDDFAVSYMANAGVSIDDYWTTSQIWEQLYKVLTIDPSIGAVSVDVGDTGTDMDDTDTDMDDTGADMDDADTDVGTGYFDDYFFCNGCYEDAEFNEIYVIGTCDNCGDISPIYNDSVEFECENCAEYNEVTIQNKFYQCPYDFCTYFTSVCELYGVTQSVSKSAIAVEDTTLIEVRGKLLKAGGFEPLDFFAFEGDTSMIDAPENGEYTFNILDENDKVVATHAFNANFVTQTNPPKEVDYFPINFMMKSPKNSTKLNILKEGTEIWSMDISEHTPEAKIDEVSTTANTIELEWSSTDKDGDEVTAELWYYDGDEEYINVGYDVKENKVTIDTTELPGSDNASIDIHASDGFNTVLVESETFVVDYKAPELLEIPEIKSYSITDEIVIDLDIYDLQDGWLLEDDQIVWTDSTGVEVSTGSFLWWFPYQLSAGNHSFTATATNSKGLTTSTEIAIEVVNDETALPQGWSRDYVADALSFGYTIPLDHIATTNLTKLQLAYALESLYSYAGGDRYLYPDDVGITDISDYVEQYEAYNVVEKGWLTMEGDQFKPFDMVTQEQALLGFYDVLAYHDPDTYIELSDEEIVELFTEIEIIDDIPENNYEADKPITREIMYVRMSKILNYILEI